jgi:cation:H+ antiporter
MADWLLAAIFVVGAAVSLGASWQLVIRLERLGARLGLSEALLGLVAALAADGPEITSATTALIGGNAKIGAGVVIGSNVFNLAALLGLGALVAGRIVLHQRVLLLEGTVAILIAGICVAVVVGGLAAPLGILACLVLLAPYVAVSSGPAKQRWLPAGWREWIAEAVTEEELELAGALSETPADRGDVLVAGAAFLVVVGASIAMEQAASTLGVRLAVPEIVIGGLVLAAVTSLPNAVSAVYLAARGRGAATLSTAMNSNALNVLAGLLIPGAIIGLGAHSGQTTLVTLWYAGLTVLALGLAYAGRGLGRGGGLVIIAVYAAMIAAVIASA